MMIKERAFQTEGLPQWLSGKELTCKAGDVGSVPGLGRCPGKRNGNPLQYSYLGNPMDRRAWWAIVHGVTKELDTTHLLNNKNIPDRGFTSCKDQLDN